MYFFYEMILGLFIIAFDMEILIGNAFKMDIASDVIGCVFIIHALTKMKAWSPCFGKSIKMTAFYGVAIILQRVIAYFEITKDYEYVVIGIASIFYINMIYNIMEGLIVKNKTEGLFEQNVNIKASSITLCMIAGIWCLSRIIGLDELFAGYDMAGGEQIVYTVCNILFYCATAFFAITLMQNKQELENISKA